MDTIQAIFFKAPNGRQEEITVRKIRSEAAKYINDRGIKVSMEDIGHDFVVYFDDGKLMEDDETPDEIIIFAAGKSCEDCMDEGVKELKERAT